MQLCAVLHIAGNAAGLQQEHGIVCVDLSALGVDDLAIAMGHYTELAVDAGDAALALTLIDGLAGNGRYIFDRALGGLIDAGAAAEDCTMGADLDIDAGELLIGIADDIGAIAGAVLLGVGILGIVSRQILTQQDHVGVCHIQVHVLT